MGQVQSFLTGAFWGLLLGGGGLVMASLLAERPAPPQHVAAPVAEPDVVAEVAPAPAPARPAMPQVRLVPPVVTPPAPQEAPPEVSMTMNDFLDALLGPVETAEPDLPVPEPEPETVPEAEASPPPAPAVRINRPGATAPEPEASLPDQGELTPLVRFAADVDYASDLPKLAVVLIDDPDLADAPAMLRDLPFLPSVVLYAGAGDVAARMQAYRAAGVEVLVQANLPAGAQPSDVEITLSAGFDLVPQAIALFSDGTGPEAANNTIAGQVMARIASDGRGFVTVQRGLGGAQRIAAQSGVPVAGIERALDEVDSQPAVERSLQQAALRARQNGQAVLLGRVTPATVAAIRAFANRTDASQLALTPVSAILLDQIADELPLP